MKKRDRDAWHRLALFASAEREGRYRASFPVVEVDRREEWVFRYMEWAMGRMYGADWRAVFLPEQADGLVGDVARSLLPCSGEMYYL